jgi:hypothetical protein
MPLPLTKLLLSLLLRIPASIMSLILSYSLALSLDIEFATQLVLLATHYFLIRHFFSTDPLGFVIDFVVQNGWRFLLRFLVNEWKESGEDPAVNGVRGVNRDLKMYLVACKRKRAFWEERLEDAVMRFREEGR